AVLCGSLLGSSRSPAFACVGRTHPQDESGREWNRSLFKERKANMFAKFVGVSGLSLITASLLAVAGFVGDTQANTAVSEPIAACCVAKLDAATPSCCTKDLTAVAAVDCCAASAGKCCAADCCGDACLEADCCADGCCEGACGLDDCGCDGNCCENGC